MMASLYYQDQNAVSGLYCQVSFSCFLLSIGYLLAIPENTIILFVSPPKFCTSIVSSFY